MGRGWCGTGGQAGREVRPWNTYVTREPDGKHQDKGIVVPPPSPHSTPFRMAGSGLESQADPGSAGAARTRCMPWTQHGKVRYSGGGVSLEGGEF